MRFNMSKISKHFTLGEATWSREAASRGIENSLDDKAILKKIRAVARNILEPVRKHYGVPFRPNSFYRNKVVNRLVGGVKNSQHLKGEAVDFEIATVDNQRLFNWIKKNLDFDQLILEYYNKSKGKNSGWVHCSYKNELANRNQAILITPHPKSGKWYRRYLPKNMNKKREYV